MKPQALNIKNLNQAQYSYIQILTAVRMRCSGCALRASSKVLEVPTLGSF